MDISIEDLQKTIPLNHPQIEKVIKQILKYLEINHATLSFVFVNRQKIRSLNKIFLKRSYFTDVLSFDLTDKKRSGKSVKGLVGEVIISTDAATQNAKVYKTLLQYELVLYIIHGILHLLGFDDHSPKDIKKMRKKEQEVMSSVLKNLNKIIQ